MPKKNKINDFFKAIPNSNKKADKQKKIYVQEISELRKTIKALTEDNLKYKKLYDQIVGTKTCASHNSENEEPVNLTNNPYHALMELETSGEQEAGTSADYNQEDTTEPYIEELAKLTRKKKQILQKSYKITEVQKAPEPEKPIKKSKMPPINFGETDVKYLKNIIKNNIKINDFEVKRKSQNENVLYTHTIEDYKKARDLLEKTEIDHYTYTPRDEKRTTLVLKNLSSDYTCEEVFNELKNQEPESVKFERVTRLSTRKSTRENRTLPIFLVQLAPKSSIIDCITNIKYIDHEVIQWERLRKTPILQCTRCQRFSHSAANCRMSPRCVKCGEPHLAKDCAISRQDPREKLFCTLCKKNGHPANYRNCEKFQGIIQSRAEASELLKQKIETKRMASRIINPNVSFASVIRNNNIHNTNLSNPNISETNTNLLLEIKQGMLNMQKEIADIKKNSNKNESNIALIFERLGLYTNSITYV
jgi:hypothetical protein